MAQILNKELSVYKQEYDNFIAELRKHHNQKGTSFRHLPSINGQEIDLYLLYWLVTAQGGWEKVNSENRWEDLLESFNLEESTVNGSLALKQIYLRYLDSYEKFYFEEDEEDDRDVYYDEEDSRSRRHRQQRIVNSVPATYNEAQHRVSDTVRSHYGMSQDLYQPTDYDRLCLSLLSPLPNEQDFAINVATLLSNEGKHTLKLSRCPRLLDLLCAHAGVFNHHSLRNYVDENYRESREYNQVQFWRDVCRNTAVLELIYDEKNFYPKPALGDGVENFFKEQFVTKYNATTSAGRLDQLRKRVEEEVTDSDLELFAVGRSEGTREPNGQRVLQVATILRNISFEEDNVPILARNLTLLRFVLLCVNSSWSNLNQTGFDILSNIASDIQLEEPEDDAVTDLMMKTLARCIGDQDRFQVISSLDVLTKLCVLQNNEDLVTRLVQSSVYRKLVDYLSLHDIHLLIATLECLYSLSSLGEAPCNSIVKTHSAVELLVSLVTVEAQSYGPKACILMRVVETVPQPGSQQLAAPPVSSIPGGPVLTSLPNAMVQPSSVTSSAPGQTVQPAPPSGAVVQTGPTTLPPANMPPASALSGAAPVATGVLPQRPALPGMSAPVSGAVGPPPNITLPKHPLPLASTRPQAPGSQPPLQLHQPPQQTVGVPGPPGQNQAGNQQVQLKVSNDEPHRVFCLSWLKATYEPATGKSIEQNIMYKQYLASMHRMGRREVISAQHYALCIRTLFGGSTGPNKKTIGDKVESHYTGIQVRTQPLPLKLTPAQAAAAQEASKQQTVSGQPAAPGQVTAVGGGVPAQPTSQQPLPVQQTLAAQKPVPYQPMPNQPAGVVPRPAQPSVIQPIVRPNTPQQVISSSATPGSGQVMQIVNQHGQVMQGQLVNSPNGQVIQVINQQGQGQLVQVSSASGGPPSQVVQKGQIVQVAGNQAGQVNIVQQPPSQVMPGQQVIQNIVNAQGQVIQKRIITQQPSMMIAGSQAQPVRVSQPGGGHMIVAANRPAAPVMVQSQSGQVIQVHGGGQGQPVLLQGGQIVIQGAGGQQAAPGGQVVIPSSQSGHMILSSSGHQNMVVQQGAVSLQNSVPNSQVITTSSSQESTKVGSKTGGKPDEVVENGLSPLDGILPKDPSFGNMQDNLTDIMHKKQQQSHHLVNGVKENDIDYSKLNGDSTNNVLGKRGPQDLDGLPAAKKPAVEALGNAPLTNGLPNGGVNSQVLNGSSPPGPTVKLVAGGQVVVQNSTPQSTTPQPLNNTQPQIIQTSSGQLYLKANGASGGSVVMQPQQVINQHGKAVLVFSQDQQQQQQQAQQQSHTQQQQIVKQVINTPSGQQIVRQVVVPANGGPIPSPVAAPVTTNGTSDSGSRPGSVPPPLTNGDSSPSPSPGPPSAAASPPPPVKIDPARPFLCEWAGCMMPFKTPKEVEKHAIAEHCPVRLEGEDIPCLWARCDGMKRKRFSLMTHFQDRHCHPQLMKLMAVRRVQIAHNGKSEVPLPPAPPPHPGYAPNAALHAIKRHAQEFATPKEQEMKDEKEGPVTKSIRLTASLILRNLVIYSPSGRLRIRAYESHLSTVALSNVESSRTVSQILYEMDNAKEFT